MKNLFWLRCVLATVSPGKSKKKNSVPELELPDSTDVSPVRSLIIIQDGAIMWPILIALNS